jgi:hypothetical protein
VLHNKKKSAGIRRGSHKPLSRGGGGKLLITYKTKN